MIRKDLERFLAAILEHDLCGEDQLLEVQRKEFSFGKFLKKPLPFDFATAELTGSLPQSIPQLLYTINDETDKTYEKIRLSLSRPIQDRNMFVAVASSGVGKTHSAYTLGHKCFLSVIRIGVSDNLFTGGAQMFSLPWSVFRNKLEQLLRVHTEDVFLRARTAYLLLNILVSSYFFASLAVIQYGKDQGLSIELIRLLLLRFFRNGISDEIIADIYQSYLEKLDCNDFSNIYTDLSKFNSMKDYEDKISCELRSKSQELMKQFQERPFMVFAFDEVQILLDKHPKLFIQNEEYLKDRENQNNPNSVSFNHYRSLFYGFTCLCQEFLSQNSIGIYFMGTDFSISKLDKLNCMSLCRANLKKVNVNSYFSRNDMVALLERYFDFPENFFQDNEVNALLNSFSGRPYYFANFVFDGMTAQKFLNSEKKVVKSLFLDFLKESLEELQEYIKDNLEIFFNSYNALSVHSHKNNRALLPILIKYVLCGNGHLPLDRNALHEAVTKRVIPVTGEMIQKKSSITLQKVEPCTFDVIRSYLLDNLKSYFDYYLLLITESVRDEKGKVAETAVAYYIVLSVLKEESRSIKIFDLLKSMTIVEERTLSKYWKVLKNVSCCATEVVDLKSLMPQLKAKIAGSTELNLFVHSTKKYDTSLLLINFDNDMGLDLAFVGLTKAKNFRLVAIQSKNHDNGGVRDALKTLSPGLQYLTNKERKSLQHLQQKEVITKAKNDGIFSKKWYPYNNWIENNPDLASHWIRIAAVSQIPSLVDFEHIYEKVPKTFLQSEEKFAYSKECLSMLTDSPLIVVSFKSPNWLNPHIQDLFVPITDGTIGKPRKYIEYLPVAYNAWKQIFIKSFEDEEEIQSEKEVIENEKEYEDNVENSNSEDEKIPS
jgi:hypothetical protein